MPDFLVLRMKDLEKGCPGFVFQPDPERYLPVRQDPVNDKGIPKRSVICGVPVADLTKRLFSRNHLIPYKDYGDPDARTDNLPEAEKSHHKKAGNRSTSHPHKIRGEAYRHLWLLCSWRTDAEKRY